MAGIAFLSKLAFVRIVFFMTAITVIRGIPIFLFRLMTGLAIQNGMPALKLKISLAMVE